MRIGMVVGRSLRYSCISGSLISAVLSLAFLSVAQVAANHSHQTQEEVASLQPEIEKQKRRLSSGEIEERRDAVMRLGALHRESASRAAVPALTDPSAIVRVAAAVAIGSLPSAESLTVLLPLLNDQDPFVRQEVAYALGGLHDRRAVAALIERIRTDKEDGVRGAAVVGLGMIGDEEAVVILAEVLSPGGTSARGVRKRKTRENSFILRAAARSLGEIKSRAGVPALIEVLANDSLTDDIRREAAQSLGLIADSSALPALRAVAAGHDPRLSVIAAEALHKIELASSKTQH